MKIMFILIATVSFSTFASLPVTNPETVCQKMSSYSDVVECLKLTRRSIYFDKRAVARCNHYFNPKTVLQCFQRIANKAYSADKIEFCAPRFTENDCLDEVGVSINHLSQYELQTLRSKPYAWFSPYSSQSQVFPTID